MKRLINILVFCCLTSNIFAQEETRVVDSLKDCLLHQEGIAKVETMAELSRALYEISFEDCVFYGEAAVEEARKTMDDEWVAWALKKLGLRYLEHYDLDLAHDIFEQAVSLIRKHKNGDGELYLDVLNYKGHVELLMGEMDMALLTFSKAMEYSILLGDDLNCAEIANYLAYIYFHKEDFKKSMEYYQNAHRRYEQLQDTLSMAQCDNNISNIYVQWQQFDKAMSLLQYAIPIFEQNDDEASLAHAYQNLGTIYATGIVDFDSAMVYLRKSIICAESVGDQMTLVEDEIELANVLKKLNYDKEAVSLYQSALLVSEAMGFQKGLLDAYRHLGIHYNEKGDFTTSAIYLKRCMDLAQEKGNQLYVNSVRPYLIADYAHLGYHAEMSKELELFMDNYESFVSESDALDDELEQLRENAERILSQYDSQSHQIQTLQTQRNHYRMAFFGLLTVALFIVVLPITYKIVRKKRAKIEKG